MTENTNLGSQATEPTPPLGPSFAEFLIDAPLLQKVVVAVAPTSTSSGHSYHIKIPVIVLHCPSKSCDGLRFYDPESEGLFLGRFQPNIWSDQLIDFRCRNCKRNEKTYALRYRLQSLNSKAVEMLKFGEIPAFGEPRPNLVREVLDDEILFFDRGYRAETAGLGIGAFAYYRRFVESHKDKIIAEIRKVAVSQGAKQDVLDTLDKAAKINSFENAVKIVKDAIPDSLRHSGGHNPLTLLHDALSAGLHNEDDEQCLELAKDIRLLLTDLAERTSQALKNNSELESAVNRLLNKATRRGS